MPLICPFRTHAQSWSIWTGPDLRRLRAPRWKSSTRNTMGFWETKSKEKNGIDPGKMMKGSQKKFASGPPKTLEWHWSGSWHANNFVGYNESLCNYTSKGIRRHQNTCAVWVQFFTKLHHSWPTFSRKRHTTRWKKHSLQVFCIEQDAKNEKRTH